MNETRGLCQSGPRGRSANHAQAGWTAATLVTRLAARARPADTTDVTWQSRLVVAKEGTHCADDPNCFNRYHPQIPAVARANPATTSCSRPATRSTAI